MNEPMGLMGTPGVGIFMLIIIGALAGWIAEKITKSDQGLLMNIVVGIVGSAIGTWIFSQFNYMAAGFFGRLIVAVIGAVILLVAWKAIKSRNTGP